MLFRSVKVEGYGNTRNQRSLFQFAHVTITEHMVNAKYGTKITNGSRVQMQLSLIHIYRDKERWRYLQKLDTKNRLLSLDGFTDRCV